MKDNNMMAFDQPSDPTTKATDVEALQKENAALRDELKGMRRSVREAQMILSASRVPWEFVAELYSLRKTVTRLGTRKRALNEVVRALRDGLAFYATEPGGDGGKRAALFFPPPETKEEREARVAAAKARVKVSRTR